MATSNILINGFQPLRLTVDRIGPFQDKIWSFDFTDREGAPCNFYLLVSANGKGKTTLIELMTCMMDMLGRDHLDKYGFESLDCGEGRAQWDILVSLSQNGKDKTVVLSLIAGTIGADTTLREWGEDDLQRLGAYSWHRFGFRRLASGRIEPIHGGDAWVEDFNLLIRTGQGEKLSDFENDALTYPTLLYFSAYRDIEQVSETSRAITQPSDWGYKIVHRFGKEGGQWTASLDNLLVWLKWLDDGRFERAVKIVNERIFRDSTKFLEGIRKDPPEAIVNNEDHVHRLDQLSSGEKSLVHICLRMGAHMTHNTLFLLDEMDVHLHSKWQHRILNWLKDMAKEHAGLTIIATTHSREIIKAYAFEVAEEGLRKGGFIIEDDLHSGTEGD